jgi:hypothetical protein
VAAIAAQDRLQTAKPGGRDDEAGGRQGTSTTVSTRRRCAWSAPRGAPPLPHCSAGLRIGYGRAARLILMEKDGIVGPPDGTRPREVLKNRNWMKEFDDSAN